jgi:hypothetical protein
MQQRMPTQAELNLAAMGDDDSITSPSGHQRMSSAVRERLSSLRSKVSSSSGANGDDVLLLQMTRKVRQLEKEKDYLVSRQTELRQEHETEVEKLKAKVRGDVGKTLPSDVATTSEGQSGAAHSDSTSMAELQAKLDQAMLKITRLEEERARQEDLEDKYQDAQMTIVNLQLHSSKHSTQIRRSNESVSTSDFISVWDGSSEGEGDEGRQDQVASSIPADGEHLQTQPKPTGETSRRPRSGSMDTANTISTTEASILMEIDSQARSDKLLKLKEFRRARECQLKELVLDNQNSPTDVQSVIQNLQEELKASRLTISKQKEMIALVQDEARLKPFAEEEEGANEESELSRWKQKYRELETKYISLEINRAWGELELRDRITNDALKFHRRLRHWKEQTEELQQQLEESMDKHVQETRELRRKLLESEQEATAIEHDFAEYKHGMERTLVEYGATKDRLVKLMEQTATVSSKESSEGSPELMQQRHLLQSAMERKTEGSSSWSTTSWIGKMREKIVEKAVPPTVDPSIQG